MSSNKSNEQSLDKDYCDAKAESLASYEKSVYLSRSQHEEIKGEEERRNSDDIIFSSYQQNSEFCS